MATSPVTVSITVSRITGVSMAIAVVRFELTAADIDGGVVGPQATSVTLDEDGEGSVQLWPNSEGTQGTQYRVTIFNSSQDLQFAGLATVPNSACNLHDVLNLEAPPVVDDAQAAALAAQGYAAAASAAATQAIEDYVAAHPTSGPTYVDRETPTGTIDGMNTGFTLAHTPSPAAGCVGYLKQGGSGVWFPLLYTDDFTLSGAVVTMNYAPDSGSLLRFSYRY